MTAFSGSLENESGYPFSAGAQVAVVPVLPLLCKARPLAVSACQ